MTEPELHGLSEGRKNLQETHVDAGENRDQHETLGTEQSSPKLAAQRSQSRPRPGTRPRRFQLGHSRNASLYGSSVGSAPSVEDDGDGIVTSMQLPSKTYTEALFSPPPPTPATDVKKIERAPTAGSEGIPTLVVSVHEDATDGRRSKAEAREEVEERRRESEEPRHTEAREPKMRHDLYDDSLEDNNEQLASLQAEIAALRGENAQLHDLFNAVNGELEELMIEDSDLQDALADDAAANDPRSAFRDGSEFGSQREATNQYLDDQDLLGPLARLVYLVKQFCRIRKWQREQQKTEQSVMASMDDPESLDNPGSPGLYQTASHQSIQLQDVWQDLPELMMQQSLSESTNFTDITLPDVLDTKRPIQAESAAVTGDEGETADEDQAASDGLYDSSSHSSVSDNSGTEGNMSDTVLPAMDRLARVHDDDEGQDVVTRGKRDSTVSKRMPESAEESQTVRELKEDINRVKNERDEALGATEHAMTERDVALDEREQFSQENEKLRRVLASLIDGQDDDGSASLWGLWPLVEEDEEAETGHKDGDHIVADDLQSAKTPKTPWMPKTPGASKSPKTPRTPWTKEGQRRQQALRDARVLLQTPPPLKSPFPLRHIHTGHVDRKWQRRQNAGSVLDIPQITLHLATAQQWENLAAVSVWLAVSCGVKDGPERVRGLWEGLRGGWQLRKQTSHIKDHGHSDSSTDVQQLDTPTVLPPLSTRPSPLPPPTTSSRNIRDLSLTLSPSPTFPLSPRPSSRPSVAESSGRLLTLLSNRRAHMQTTFPADAMAELLISLLVLSSVSVAIFVAFCTATERRLWLDHNADWPRTYLHHHLQQYRPDTSTSTRLSFAGYDSLQEFSSVPAFQWCVCMPVPVDPRFVTVPLAEHAAYWRDWAGDVVRWMLAP